mmetsp:Transcript_25888/g.28784  ORF Transcript_25888/g.28784 Transcript_25888/m.28784 type:complete len:192 (-) Transcript_25888:89-664(-)
MIKKFAVNLSDSTIIESSSKGINTHPINILIDGVHFTLNIWDIAGGDQFSSVYPLAFDPKPDVVLLCYSLIDPNSLRSIAVFDKWTQLITKYCPSKPVILVGTKSDLVDPTRSKKSRNRNSMVQGLDAVRSVGACEFFQCSMHDRRSVQRIFNHAVLVGAHPAAMVDKKSDQVTNKKKRKKKKSSWRCNIL